jgi:coenzyme F420 hydrogenase subunit beta
MSFSKASFEDSLQKNVVSTGKCVGCGACVAACPFGCLGLVQGKSDLLKECKVCGVCSESCPQDGWSLSEAENFVFGRRRKGEEEFGVFRRIAVAKARDNELLKLCQDGGVVTALLLYALNNKIIDSAAVSGISRDKLLYPVAKLATTHEEILDCAGTRYTCSPNLLALAEAADQKKVSTAFVGTPCQIRAVRKMQMHGLKLASHVNLLIGLMCSECFTYEGLMEEHIHEKLGIDLRNVKGMNIKGKMIVTMKSGSAKTIPLAEVKQYVRKGCGFCSDLSSELADISAGGLGLNGSTFTIIRTRRGEELFSEAESSGVLESRKVSDGSSALNLLRRLSKKKRSSYSY